MPYSKEKRTKRKKTNYISDLQTPVLLLQPNRENIITQLYERKDLKKIIRKMAKITYLVEELTSELFLWLCKMNESDLLDYYNRKVLDFVILKFLMNSFHSSTSPFYHKIKKYELGLSMTPKQKETYLMQQKRDQTKSNNNLYHEALETVMGAMNSLPHKHMTVLKLYIELKSYKKVSDKTGIGPRYISQMVKDAREELGKKISGLIEFYKEEQFIKDLFENYQEDNE